MKNSFIRLGIITTCLLLIPLIAMQFTDEVNWKLMDFLIGGILIFLTGSLLELSLKKVKKTKYRILTFLIVVAVFLLIWTELAVGIFGTPFGGS